MDIFALIEHFIFLRVFFLFLGHIVLALVRRLPILLIIIVFVCSGLSLLLLLFYLPHLLFLESFEFILLSLLLFQLGVNVE